MTTATTMQYNYYDDDDQYNDESSIDSEFYKSESECEVEEVGSEFYMTGSEYEAEEVNHSEAEREDAGPAEWDNSSLQYSQSSESSSSSSSEEDSSSSWINDSDQDPIYDPFNADDEYFPEE